MSNKQPNEHIDSPVVRHRFVGALAATLILIVLLLGRPFAALSDDTLFAPVSDKLAFNPLTLDIEVVESARRVRPVQINWSALDPQAEELHLNLFPGLTLTAKLRRVDPTITGGYVWVGDIIGEMNSTVTLSIQDGVLSGGIYRHGREWGGIRYAGERFDDIYLVLESDPRAPQPAGLDYAIPQSTAGGKNDLLMPHQATCEEDGSVIDLMVVYTPAARDTAGGQAAIEALINQRVSDMNLANDASAAPFQWRLTHVEEVDYRESGSLSSDLQYLQAIGDGTLDAVHAARDNFSADFVAMMVAEGNSNACGYAYQMSVAETWFQAYTFGVTALEYPGEYVCGSLTLAHEFGHNLGNAHDRDHTAGPVLFPYSYGYQSPLGTFRTIMSYDCPNGCERINQWANPDIWYAGEPTGVDAETDPGRAADTVRSMDQVRRLVSNFRANCGVEPAATPTEASGPTETPAPTQTLVDMDTPTPTVIPTDLPEPTLDPDPSPTSAFNGVMEQQLFLPAVIQK